MGTDRKTPLSQAGTAAPERSQKTQQRSKVARTRLIVGGVVVLALVGGAALLATRGGESVGIIEKLIGSDDGRPVPEVTLTVSSATFEATSHDADVAAQESTTEKASAAVTGSLEAMLRTAYVDPDTWDDPGAVADSFTGDASDRIEADVAVLTMGDGAGDVYEFVDPGKATVSVEILTGGQNEALRAFAHVTFPGLAEHDDGTYTKLVIDGSYFLVHEDGAWKIDSYRVDRQEKKAKPPASASASATASASEEASG